MFQYAQSVINLYAAHLWTAYDNSSEYLPEEQSGRVEQVYNDLDVLFSNYAANEHRDDRALARFVIDMAREYLNAGVEMARGFLEEAGYAFVDEEDFEVVDLEEWQERQAAELADDDDSDSDDDDSDDYAGIPDIDFEN